MTHVKQKIIKKIKDIALTISIIFFIFTTTNANTSGSASLDVLETLDLQNDRVQSLRKDVRSAIVIIKKRGDVETLPDLKFYTYKVKKEDNFWKILSKTSLNIDTLSSINSLSSSIDVTPGKVIFISNMRGIIYKVNNNDSIEIISKKYNVDKEYISRVNKIKDYKITKEYLFIPSGEISNIERSLFLGIGFACPLRKSIRTSAFGRRVDPFNKRFGFHTGLDLACPPGSSVYAARNGKVVFTGYNGGYGLLVILKHEHGYSTYYGHLKSVLVKVGDVVERGAKIAVSGNSGRSTGPHLHFEVRKNTLPINPRILL